MNVQIPSIFSFLRTAGRTGLLTVGLFGAGVFGAGVCGPISAELQGGELSEISSSEISQGIQSVFLSIRDRMAPSLVRLEMMGGMEQIGNEQTGFRKPIRVTTGVLATSDGFLFASAVAFAHGPNAVIAVTSDGKRFPARLVSTDLRRKIALLKIDAVKDEAPMRFQVPEAVPVSEMRPGQKLLALGRVLDPDVPSFSTGILSGMNRQLGMAIQTDAHVSPANYGGPLTDLDGRVLGILTPFGMGPNELLSGMELYDSGIGFAIPFEELLAFLPEMQTRREWHPAPKLGLVFGNPAPILADLKVRYVKEDSLASKAGIQVGDLMTHINGISVKRGIDFQREWIRYTEGDTVRIRFLRGEESREIEILLENLAKNDGK